MSADINLCGVILAAGASSRMGRDKALLPWPPDASSGTLLSAAIDALAPFTQKIIVVAGANLLDLKSTVEMQGAELVHNPEPERGQFSSIQTGLRAALDSGCVGVMLTPVDCPPLAHDSLRKLREAFQQAVTRGAWAVAPEHQGRRGHPLIAGYPLIRAFLDAPATSNPREVKRTCADKFEYLPVADPLLTIDLNTPAEYAHAADLLEP